MGCGRSYIHPLWLNAQGRLPAAEAVVLETGCLDLRRLGEISPVNDDRGSHEGPHLAEVQRPELVPVGEDEERVVISGRLEKRIRVGETIIVRIQPFLVRPRGTTGDGHARP